MKASIQAYPDYNTVGFGRWGCVLKGQKDIIGLDQIIGLVRPANAASIRVLEKAGLQRIGNVSVGEIDAIRYEINRPSLQRTE